MPLTRSALRNKKYRDDHVKEAWEAGGIRFVDTLRNNLLKRNTFTRAMITDEAPTSGAYSEIIRDCFYDPRLDVVYVVIPR